MELEGSLPCLQEPTVVPYNEPALASQPDITVTLIFPLNGPQHVAHYNIIMVVLKSK
jgi:hypothetical protein